MATFTFRRSGGDLVKTVNGIESKNRINLFTVKLSIDTPNNKLILQDGTMIDFNADTVTDYLTIESLCDQIGLWIEDANSGN